MDLKTKSLSGVRCRYCEWITNDRSPTTLKFHLKRKHDTGFGGVWNIVEERIGINAPHYRNRGNKNVCYNTLETKSEHNNSSFSDKLSQAVL